MIASPWKIEIRFICDVDHDSAHYGDVRVLGYHSGVTEVSSLLICEAVWIGK